MTATTMPAVLLDGMTLRDPSREILAQWDGSAWRSADGAIVTELAVTIPRVQSVITATARRDADQAWIDEALVDLRALAARCDTFTSDDVWAALRFPPRESRMIGNLLARAKTAGVCEPTDQHRPSRRGMNHGRPVRVWRSRPSMF